jgi:putative DNA primase/helicase
MGTVNGLLTVDLDQKILEDGSVVDGQLDLDEFLSHKGFSQGEINALFDTLTQRTGGGGKHLIYSLDNPVSDDVDLESSILEAIQGHKSVNRWLPSVDIKADGGYVIVTPSLGISGNRYQWQVDSDSDIRPAYLPPPFSALLAEAKPQKGTDVGARGGKQGESGVNVEYDYSQSKIDGPPLGARDEFFNAYAFELRKQNYDRETAIKELRRVWEKTPNPEEDQFSWEDVKEKLDRVWKNVDPDPEYGSVTALSRMADALDSSPLSILHDDDDGLGEDNSGKVKPLAGKGSGLERMVENETDLGNSYRIERLFDGKLIFVDGKGWYLWNGNYFEHDVRHRVLDIVPEGIVQDIQREASKVQHTGDKEKIDKYERWILKVQSRNGILAMMDLAKARKSIAVSADELNSDPWIAVAQNGTLDLGNPGGTKGEGWELRESSIHDRATQCLGVVFDPTVPCPKWEEHVRTVTRGDQGLAEFLQRWAGYSLTGNVGEQKFAFCFGRAATGKNVFIETIMRVMGSYADVGSMKLLMDSGREHETMIADLHGLRMMFIDETLKSRINEARVKQLTGSGRIKARKMRQDFFSFDSTVKLWIAGNKKPRIDDTSEGVWRRLDLIPFDALIPPTARIGGYGQIMFEQEGSGILNWMLEGLRQYLEFGGLKTPEIVQRATDEYKEAEDLWGDCITELFEVESPTAQYVWTPTFVCFGLMREWAEAHGYKIPGERSLGQELTRFGFTSDPQPRKIRSGIDNKSRAVKGRIGPPLRTAIGPYDGHLNWRMASEL